MYKSLAEAIRDAEARGVSLSTVALEAESADGGRSIAHIRHALSRALTVMRGAITIFAVSGCANAGTAPDAIKVAASSHALETHFGALRFAVFIMSLVGREIWRIW